MYGDLPCAGVRCGGVVGVFFGWGMGVDGVLFFSCLGFLIFGDGGLGAGDVGLSFFWGGMAWGDGVVVYWMMTYGM